jgi:hypothetical protein
LRTRICFTRVALPLINIKKNISLIKTTS